MNHRDYFGHPLLLPPELTQSCLSSPTPCNALQHVINGSAHHSDHHTAYNYNYGQYFTLWDRLGGSYRHPSALYGKGCVWM